MIEIGGKLCAPWQYVVDNKSDYVVGYQSQINSSLASLHFLHGNGFAVGSYRHFLAHFANDYNLLLQDAAGHGESSSGEKFVGWNETANRFVKSLQSRLPQLPATERIGMGHSFGGCLTALMSAQEPGLFDRIVLLDPAMYPPKVIWMLRGVRISGFRRRLPMVRQASRRRTHWESLANVKASFKGRGTFKGWQDRCLDDYIRYSVQEDEDGQCYLRCPTWMEAAVFSSYPKGLWQLIRSVKVPTYIIQGESSYDFFIEAHHLAARLNPNIKVVTVKGGHCFMQEDPAAAAQQVKSWLDSFDCSA
ncbi:haloalkane dehalogenase [Marinomonas spartinae]|uniref:Haloalkane dehalogenase n=1 Tax=Marinomonas spartinae TaxID=1792290 RepID=A0A1A8TRE2_9GAMM|nr:alpha/beta hydrolase [Marinomonas spartinae]SBS30838.1 haloalkane dehalogenase [Marinomonas spartinae]SBS37075.1 haloalkane dehalogenase [Marinomonas spartinae]